MDRTGKKMKEQKNIPHKSLNHIYCQLCLKSECKWCHMCVTYLKFVKHPCVHKTCVTGNNVVLHKDAIEEIEACLDKLRQWMSWNFLKLNNGKT